eukprot:scaffold101729_cov39-Tisochrysis_lutea.AAC.1
MGEPSISLVDGSGVRRGYSGQAIRSAMLSAYVISVRFELVTSHEDALVPLVVSGKDRGAK